MLFPAPASEARSSPTEPSLAASVSTRIAHRWWLILLCALVGSLAGFGLHASFFHAGRTRVNTPDHVAPSLAFQAANDRLLQASAELKGQLQVLRNQAAGIQAPDAPQVPVASPAGARLQTLQQAILDTQAQERSSNFAGDPVAYAAAEQREDLLRLSLDGQLQKLSAPQRKAAQAALLQQEIESTAQASNVLDHEIAKAQPMYQSNSHPKTVPAPATPFASRRLPLVLAGASLGAIFGLLLVTILGRKSRPPARPAQPEPSVPLRSAIPDLTSSAPDGPYDPFQILAYSVLLKDWDKKIRRYAVTSAQPGSGKTTVAANMGIALSRAQLRVVIVDANLQNPTLHRHFDLSNDFGLREILRGQADPVRDPIAELIQPTSHPGLSILLAGNTAGTPETLLKAPQLRRLLDRLDRDFDLVLIDLPAVSSQALIVASECQGAVLVLPPGESDNEATRSAIESLAARDIHISGSAINHLPMAS